MPKNQTYSYDALLLHVHSRLKVRVLPAEERRERDDDGREPDHENHRPDRAKRSRVDVVDVRHGPVSGMNNREILGFLNGPIPTSFCLLSFLSHSNSNEKYTI